MCQCDEECGLYRDCCRDASAAYGLPHDLDSSNSSQSIWSCQPLWKTNAKNDWKVLVVVRHPGRNKHVSFPSLGRHLYSCTVSRLFWRWRISRDDVRTNGRSEFGRLFSLAGYPCAFSSHEKNIRQCLLRPLSRWFKRVGSMELHVQMRSKLTSVIITLRTELWLSYVKN